MEEVWKIIPNTNNDYLVSNLGRIKSRRYKSQYEILKNHIGNTGYEEIKIHFSNKDKRETVNVHRLVAECFCKKPITNNKLEVNHIDSNRSNNIYTNLEWVTSSGNTEHAVVNKKLIPWNNPRKPIKATNIETGEVKIFISISKAEQELGTRHITTVLKGKRNQAKGYVFEYIKGGDVPNGYTND